MANIFAERMNGRVRPCLSFRRCEIELPELPDEGCLKLKLERAKKLLHCMYRSTLLDTHQPLPTSPEYIYD